MDGTQTRLAFVLSACAVILPLRALLGFVGWVLPADGRRLMAMVVGGRSGFLGTGRFGALLGQRAVIGVALGGLSWALNPVLPRPITVSTTAPAEAPRIPVAEGEQLVWFGWTAAAPWVVWVCLALVALGWFVAVVASPWAAVGPAFGIVLLRLMGHARMVVDADGLRVMSAGVFPWLRVPLSSVA
ncbi:MAG: hypothetical protein ABJA74_14580 [Lapillicoccus sp.]